MALFRLNIEWSDDSKKLSFISIRLKKQGREVNDGSTLTVKGIASCGFRLQGQGCGRFSNPVFTELKTGNASHSFQARRVDLRVRKPDYR